MMVYTGDPGCLRSAGYWMIAITGPQDSGIKSTTLNMIGIATNAPDCTETESRMTGRARNPSFCSKQAKRPPQILLTSGFQNGSEEKPESLARRQSVRH